MDRANMMKKIRWIRDSLETLKNNLDLLEKTEPKEQPEAYRLRLTDAALRSEEIACRMRRLLYQTTNCKKSEYLKSAAETQGIEIREKDGVQEITLPCLLPKRKKEKGNEFLSDPLFFALDQYTGTHRFTRYRHCVVCFSHIYKEEIGEKQIRDYDNLETKSLLDVIAAFFMEDDSGLLIDTYHTTQVGKENATRISVMAPEHFSGWLASQKAAKNHIGFSGGSG